MYKYKMIHIVHLVYTEIELYFEFIRSDKIHMLSSLYALMFTDNTSRDITDDEFKCTAF